VAETHSVFPTTLTAGNRWRVVRAFEQRAADGWSMRFRAVQLLGADAIDVDGVDDGAAWTFDLTPEGTNRTPGKYTWTLIAQKGEPPTDRCTPEMGRLSLRPNPATATGTELASQDEIDLAAVRKVLRGIVDGETADYQIGGQLIRLLSITDLQRLEARLAARVVARQNGGRLPAYRFVAR
jgi:hypothetical protein